ncbi:hypothetical protein QS468_12840 [Bacillus subtilis]|jgi:hypothetical protein|nr:hypothetical protein [Pseudomonas sp. A29(2023)]MDL5593597.1 hypothetical protein [Bacillus subtilis]
MKRSLSWTVGFGRACKGGVLRESSWSDVVTQLEKSCQNLGSVTLDVDELPGFELLTLQVVSGSGKYFLTLGEDDGNEYNVKMFVGDEALEKVVNIQGEPVDGSVICWGFNTVVEVFSQLFGNGRVGLDLMK